MELARLIRAAYKNNGVVVAYVYGDFGFGKTSYALWTAYEVLGSWDRVLKYLFFTPAEAIKTMAKAIDSGKRLPIIIMDDAGLWLDRLTWYDEHKILFMEFFNLIRSVAAGVIFTTPSEELPKQLIRKCMFRINVRPANLEEIRSLGVDVEEVLKMIRSYSLKPVINIATGYRLKTLPSFMAFVKKVFYDVYPLQYPNSVFKKYERIRRDALKYYFSKLADKVLGENRSSRKTRTKKQELLELAKKMLSEGMDRRDIVKKLMELGVSQATAYRYVAKVMQGKTNSL